MESTGSGHEQDPGTNSSLLRRISRTLTPNHAVAGVVDALDDVETHSKASQVKATNGHSQLDGYEMARTRSSASSSSRLEQPLTIGGEPNPEAPHTPEPEPETPEERKELPPPGLLSLDTIALLAPFGIFGLLARLGVTALATYSNQAVFSLAWVQAAGCFVMGIAQHQKPFIMSLCVPLVCASSARLKCC